jgi:hypothetical protein
MGYHLFPPIKTLHFFGLQPFASRCKQPLICKKIGLYRWTLSCKSFLAIPSTPNSNSICIHNNCLFETSCKLSFLVLIDKLLDAATRLYCPRAEGQGGKNQVCFIHRILDFYFFFSFFLLKCFLHMVLHDVIFNVTPWIWHCSL